MKLMDGVSRELPLREVEIIHNPALGAYLQWRAGAEYQEAQGNAMPLLLSFLILPLLLHRQTLEIVNSTQKSSGLALFASKLGERREDLLALHARTLALRQLSFSSLAAGISSQMLLVNYEAATMHATHIDKPPMIPERIKPMTRGAERLGSWFSKLPVNQVATLLRIDY